MNAFLIFCFLLFCELFTISSKIIGTEISYLGNREFTHQLGISDIRILKTRIPHKLIFLTSSARIVFQLSATSVKTLLTERCFFVMKRVDEEKP